MFDKYNKINKVAIGTGLNISSLKSWQIVKSNLKCFTFASFTSFFLMADIQLFFAHLMSTDHERHAKNRSRHHVCTPEETESARSSWALRFDGGMGQWGICAQGL